MLTQQLTFVRLSRQARARALSFLCERAPGVAWRVMQPALSSGAFRGVVYPDFREVGADATVGLATTRSRDADETRATSSGLVVQTIAGRRCGGGLEDVRQRALEAVRVEAREVGLLAVSGDGDDDDATGVGSMDVLRELATMRARGEFARDVKLFAAANPMRGDADAARMVQKRELGVDGFLTQPALLSEAFSAWHESVVKYGALDDSGNVSCHLGVACITSTKSLDFWLNLTGVNRSASPEARMVFDDFVAHEIDMSPEVFHDWAFERLELATMHAISTRYCDGAHFMPVTRKGFAFAETLASSVLKTFLSKV